MKKLILFICMMATGCATTYRPKETILVETDADYQIVSVSVDNEKQEHDSFTYTDSLVFIRLEYSPPGKYTHEYETVSLPGIGYKVPYAAVVPYNLSIYISPSERDVIHIVNAIEYGFGGPSSTTNRDSNIGSFTVTKLGEYKVNKVKGYAPFFFYRDSEYRERKKHEQYLSDACELFGDGEMLFFDGEVLRVSSNIGEEKRYGTYFEILTQESSRSYLIEYSYVLNRAAIVHPKPEDCTKQGDR